MNKPPHPILSQDWELSNKSDKLTASPTQGYGSDTTANITLYQPCCILPTRL